MAQSRRVFIFTYPVITVILSVLILHEKITVISIIGTVLILIGLVISQKTKTTDQIRCIICDNKAKKEIVTMYYVPEESREKAVHPRQNGSLFR